MAASNAAGWPSSPGPDQKEHELESGLLKPETKQQQPPLSQASSQSKFITTQLHPAFYIAYVSPSPSMRSFLD